MPKTLGTTEGGPVNEVSEDHGEAEMGVIQEGLMMDVPLTTHLLMRRLATVGRAARIVSVGPEENTRTVSCGEEIVVRATGLASGLSRLGISVGDRVASLAWNTREHLETYWAVTGLGAILHTVNLRLFPEQIAYTINHARDRVLIIDASLASTILPILHQLTTIEHVIVIDDEGQEAGASLPDQWMRYEAVLDDEAPEPFSWPSVPERAGAALCYTSGTTGNPKGVLYSHRSIVLHALTMASSGGFRLDRSDRVLALVPLFHALGWGLPFITAVTGSDLILPGRQVSPEALLRLIPDEGVTWTGGVPTLWMDLLKAADHAEEADGTAVTFPTLKAIMSGGTKVPVSLMQAYGQRWGVDMGQGWGMTETLPGAALSMTFDEPTGQVDWDRRAKVGQASPTYEFRIVGHDGHPLPTDGLSIGEIQVRGPLVAASYLNDPKSEDSFDDGWLKTGDIGSLTSDGWVEVCDRVKDVIKSGGEWISSQDLEAALISHPDVDEVAVIGVPDDRWSERPLAFFVSRAEVNGGDLQAHLSTRVARWWIPERFVQVAEIPRNSTGKADKKALRGFSLESQNLPS